MRRSVFLIAALCLLSAAFVAAPIGAEPAKAKITVWAWPSNDQAFKAAIQGFNQKYPNIEVAWEMKTGHSQTRDALLAAFAADEGAPDISLIELSWIGTMALGDGFVNLLAKPYNAGKYKKDMVGYKWDLATSPKGELMAFPWDIGPACIFYRRDVLDKAGIPSDPAKLAKALKTWDDYYAMGKKVNDPANKVWWTDTAGAVPYIYYAHKNFFDKDMNVAIDNPTTRKVLALAKKMRNEGLDAKTTPWTDEWYTMLNKGQVATVISGCWFGGFLKGWIAKDTAGKWGVIPVPEQPLQNWGGSFLGVTKQSKNPEAAWKFIEYLTTDPDATRAVLKSNDFLPSYKPVWKDPVYDEADAFFGGQKTRRLWLDIASSQGPFTVTPLDSLAESAFNDEMAKFLDQNLEVEATIKSMVKAIDAATAADRKVVLKQMGKGK
jgi:multiple sugar transport system substrate-binding protein